MIIVVLCQVCPVVLLHGDEDGQLQGEEALPRPPAPGGCRPHEGGRAQGQGSALYAHNCVLG